MTLARLRRLAWLCALTALGPAALWGQGPKPVEAGLSLPLRPETLQAEQLLPAMVPAGSDPIHRLGRLFKPLGAAGRVPQAYTPAAAREFDVPAQLLPPEQADVISAGSGVEPAIQEALYKRDHGRTLVRRFLHPLEAARLAGAGALFDGAAWRGTPSSSVRSLLMTGTPAPATPFVAKTSLGYVVAGVDRRVDREHARLAVQVSAYYDDIARETGGRIPNTDKTWTHFKESAAVGVKGEDAGYTLMRSLPADYSRTIYLPFYALIARRPDGTRWIDELYAASGYGDKLAFVWNELAKPLLEFHLMVDLEHGIVTELHQQNALLRVDPRTKRILGVSTRDMDGHSIDYAARKHWLGLPVVEGGLTQDNSRTYGYLFAKGMPMLGYEYFKDAIFKNVMKFFLEPADVRRLVGLGNDTMLRRFNEKHAARIGPVRRFLDLPAAFARLYASVLPADEAAFFRAEERSYRRAVHPLALLMKGLIFGYYRLKQRLERSELPTRSAFADRRGVEPLLGRIQAEAQGVVPSDALAFWLAMQRAAPRTFDERVSLDGGPAASARERRARAFAWARRREDALRASGAAVKAARDFPDEGPVVAGLFDYASPYWYTRSSLDHDDFARLFALPLNVGGLQDGAQRVDGYDMAPVEFLRHDELHSLSASAGLDELLRRRGVVKGSAAYYEYVLERVRLTKAFLAWSDALPPRERAAVKAIWFDAFHEHFAKRWPLHRYHQNLALSREALSAYVGSFVDARGRLRPWRRVQAALGLGAFARLPRGDAEAAFAALAGFARRLTPPQD